MNTTSIGVMLSISEVLVKCGLFRYFDTNHGLKTPHFQPIEIGTELSETGSKFLRTTQALSFATLIQICLLVRLVSKICLPNIFSLADEY